MAEKYKRQYMYLPHHVVCQGERREDAIFIFAMQPPSPTAVIDNDLHEEITEGRTEECQSELSFLA